MRIVFMGTPRFAATCVNALATQTRHELVAVYSRPDAASHRGRALHPAPAKVEATRQHVPVRTPDDFSDPATIDELASFEPDVIITAAFGVILPQAVLDLPRYACINVHASLLPRWRGAAPIQRAILDGDDIAGVCVMQVEEGLDTGRYHTVGSVEIANKTTEELVDQLGEMGAEGMLEALAQIEDGVYEWTEQDESEVTYAEKVSKDETLLRPGLTNREFLRRVQASSHRAPSRCVVCGKVVTVIKAHAANTVLPQGSVVLEKKHIFLGLKGRAVELDVVKPENKREMEAKQWIAGLHNVEDKTWNVLPEYYHKLPVYG